VLGGQSQHGPEEAVAVTGVDPSRAHDHVPRLAQANGGITRGLAATVSIDRPDRTSLPVRMLRRAIEAWLVDRWISGTQRRAQTAPSKSRPWALTANAAGCSVSALSTAA
jgi:hypothetical protein